MIKVLRQILNGEKIVDMTIKYKAICFGASLVHFFFMVMFGMIHIWLLSAYNFFITGFYLYHTFVSLKKKRYVFIYFSSLVEIMFHSSMCSILLGWNWGFMIYTIALVPVLFYFCFTLKGHNTSIILPFLSSLYVIICYTAVSICCENMEPFYKEQDFGNIIIIFYYFNTVVAFLLLLVFSTLFALEIRSMQRQLQSENDRLGEVANFDPLTRLMNRRKMNMCIKKELENVEKDHRTFCLVMGDIDDFKRVNDTYGHNCGDQVLIRVADIVTSNIHEQDFACRWGGEEILILIRDELEKAEETAQRIRKDVESAVVHYKDDEVKVTLTLGIAKYHNDVNIWNVIEEADKHLYEGKKNGKNQVVK